MSNRANQLNPNYSSHRSGYRGLGTYSDLNNHANQLNPNNALYRGSKKVVKHSAKGSFYIIKGLIKVLYIALLYIVKYGYYAIKGLVKGLGLVLMYLVKGVYYAISGFARFCLRIFV